MYFNREISLTSLMKSSNPGTEPHVWHKIIYEKTKIYMCTYIKEGAAG